MSTKKTVGKVITKPGLTPDYHYDADRNEVEILWKCLRCGELMPRGLNPPETCPSCGAPKTEFVLVDED